MSTSESDPEIDAQMAVLRARKASRRAEAKAAKQAAEKEAKNILIGATPTKGKPESHPTCANESGVV